jgi:hypothetical protein
MSFGATGERLGRELTFQFWTRTTNSDEAKRRGKFMRYVSKPSIRNALILILALFFLFGCSGTKPATKPTSSAQPTTEQSKKEELPVKPPSKPDTVSPEKPSPPPSSPTPKATPAPPLRITKVVWTAVNLREGPGTSYKVIGNAKKGTSLAILEVREDWLRVRLEDKGEAWVIKSATSEAPKPPPPTPPTPSKPTPM